MFGLAHKFHKAEHKVWHVTGHKVGKAFKHTVHEAKVHPLLAAALGTGLGYGAYSLLAGSGGISGALGAVGNAVEHPISTGESVLGRVFNVGKHAIEHPISTLGSVGGEIAKPFEMGTSLLLNHPAAIGTAAALATAAHTPKVKIPQANIPDGNLPSAPNNPFNMLTNSKPYRGFLGGMYNGLFGRTKTNYHLSGSAGNHLFSLLDEKRVTL